jgi:uncharacterized membrane protein
MSYDVEDSKLLSLLWPFINPSADLLLGMALTVTAVVTIFTTGGAVRVVAGLPLLAVLPGYAIVAALFPGRPSHTTRPSPGIGTRLALSVGLSVAVAVLTTFALGVAGIGLTTASVGGSLGLLCLVVFVVAGRRRLHLPPEQRFEFPLRRWMGTLYSGVFREESGVDAALNVALAVAVVLGVSALGYALVVPAGSASFSSFSVLSTDTDQPVAGNYSTDLVEGVEQEYMLAVENHEHEDTTYTVVAQLQRVDNVTDTVTERVRVDNVTGAVQAGATWTPTISVTPSLTGENLRLAMFLYTDEPPTPADRQSADEQLYLWVDVSES